MMAHIHINTLTAWLYERLVLNPGSYSVTLSKTQIIRQFTMRHFFRPAVIVSALPTTITNGQIADATILMADLNHIVNQVNANAADVALVAILASANTFTAVQSGVSATSPSNFPTATQVQNSVFLTLTSTLGTNTITARCAALTLGALVNGQIFTFVPSQTNTGPVTLNPDGLGNATIMMLGTNVLTGTIIKDVPLAVRYQSPYFHALNANGTMATRTLGAVPGTATNDSAAAGVIGEYISSEVLAGSAVSLTSPNAADVTSISLTAGDWDVSGNVVFVEAATTTSSLVASWISAVSATPPTLPNAGAYARISATLSTGGTQTLPTGTTRISLAATTTIYLSCLAIFAISTETAYGFIGARRAR